MKKLSENLALLSERTAKLEARAESAKTENKEKLDKWIEDVRTQAKTQKDKFDAKLEETEEATKSGWQALRKRVEEDLDSIRDSIESAQEALDIQRAERRADRAEAYAAEILDFMLLTILEAEEAVAAAIEARLHADTLQTAGG